MERVEIGDAVLSLHVARLAEADQVIERIGFVCGGEQPKRLDVMDRDGFPDGLPAMLAFSAVPLYRLRSGNKPTFPAVCGDATNPLRGVFAGLFFRAVSGIARLGAKAKAGLCFVLPFQPRLQFESLAALSARVNVAIDDIHRRCLLSGESIGWAKPFAPFVADLVIARHHPYRHVPLAATGLTAKSGCVGAVRLHLKRGAAYLALLGNHDAMIPRSMGFGTTGVAMMALRFWATACLRIEEAYKQADLFVPAPTAKPVQQALFGGEAA